MMPVVVRVFLVAVFVGTALLGPTPVGLLAGEQQSAFRAGTQLVRVDVTVRDRAGQVIRGLTAADFIVTEDGKAQDVTSFDFEEIATERLPQASTVPAV